MQQLRVFYSRKSKSTQKTEKIKRKKEVDLHKKSTKKKREKKNQICIINQNLLKKTREKKKIKEVDLHKK